MSATHSSLELLRPSFQPIVVRAIAAMEADPELRAAGAIKIIPTETLRDLAVQIANYSRWLWERLGKREDQKAELIKYVKEMFKAAGLWEPTDSQCLTFSTQTLDSKHRQGLAVDLAPSRDGKNPWWTAPLKVWQRMGAIGKSFGMKWGGDFPWKNPDNPHFEAP